MLDIFDEAIYLSQSRRGRKEEGRKDNTLPVKYEYDPIKNLVHARPYGELSITEIGNYFKDVADDNKIRNGIIEVVHFDNVDNFLFSSKDASSIPILYNELKAIKQIKGTIFIGNDDINFGIARMFEMLFEISDLKDDVFVVRNEEEADKLIETMID